MSTESWNHFSHTGNIQVENDELIFINALNPLELSPTPCYNIFSVLLVI